MIYESLSKVLEDTFWFSLMSLVGVTNQVFFIFSSDQYFSIIQPRTYISVLLIVILLNIRFSISLRMAGNVQVETIIKMDVDTRLNNS